MDPMDYLLHNSPPRAPSHQDSSHGPNSPWGTHPSSSQSYPWPPHHNHLPTAPGPQGPPLASHPHLGPVSFYHAPPGGLPPPPLTHGSRGMPPQDPFMPPRHWNTTLQPIPGPLPPAVAPPSQMGQHGGSQDNNPFAPGGRGLNFQAPPGAPGGAPGFVPPGATSDRQSLPPRWLFSSPEASPNTPSQQQASSHFNISSPPPFFTTPPPHSTHFPFSSHRRAPRSELPASPFPPIPIPSGFAGLPSPPSERRRPGHTRARRSMAARLTVSDPVGDDNDDSTSRSLAGGSSGQPRRATQSTSNIEEIALRQIQVLRGASTIKMVASRRTLQSLQSVNIEDLPESEKTCVICYNEFGVETPEGINEAPLRLPKCKHVFGDHCIKKWFEDSDSCPYCRDKLHSEPKHQSAGSARTFLNMMRLRGGSSISPNTMPEEIFMRVMSSGSADPLLVDLAAARRSPPDDEEEHQRRTRPRRSESISRAPLSPSRGRRIPYGQLPSADDYPAHDPLPRPTHWDSISPSHRRAATLSGPPLDVGVDGERHFAPAALRFGAQRSVNMGHDESNQPTGFTAGSGPASQSQALPNPLQVFGGGSGRDETFRVRSRRSDSAEGPASSTGTSGHPIAGAGGDSASRSRHQPW